jgi:hypothetical protein
LISRPGRRTVRPTGTEGGEIASVDGGQAVENHPGAAEVVGDVVVDRRTSGGDIDPPAAEPGAFQNRPPLELREYIKEPAQRYKKERKVFHRLSAPVEMFGSKYSPLIHFCKSY